MYDTEYTIDDYITETVINDAKDYIATNGIEDYVTEDDEMISLDEEYLFDDLINADEVTGNGAYGHTPRFDDKELAEIIFDSRMFRDYIDEFGISMSDLKDNIFGSADRGRQWIDTIARIAGLEYGMADIVKWIASTYNVEVD